MEKLLPEQELTIDAIKKAVSVVYELEVTPKKAYIMVVSDNMKHDEVVWLSKAINEHLGVKAILIPKSWLPDIYEHYNDTEEEMKAWLS